MSTIVDVKDVSKSFFTGVIEVKVLKEVSVKIQKGSFAVVFGPSGCGKSTLLHIILGLEKPTVGKVIFLEKDLYQDSDEDDRSEFRKNHIGMVYQQPNWIKSLTVVENVAFPLLLRGAAKAVSLNKAEEIIKTLAMSDWANYVPTELSSGQQQRIALARALVTDPEVIIADEPTGNLDFESGQELMTLMTKLNKQGKTIVMVTHDLEYLSYSTEAIEMFNGKVIDTYNQTDKAKLLKKLSLTRGKRTFKSKKNNDNVN